MSCHNIDKANNLFTFCINDCELARKDYINNIIVNNTNYLDPTIKIASDMNKSYIKRYNKCLKNCVKVETSYYKQIYN